MGQYDQCPWLPQAVGKLGVEVGSPAGARSMHAWLGAIRVASVMIAVIEWGGLEEMRGRLHAIPEVGQKPKQ